MICNRSFCRKLRECLDLDHSVWRSKKVNVMSTDGKILAVLVANPNCIVKDLPSLARVSQRAAFESLKKLEEIGVVEKIPSSKDRRATQIQINHEHMCKTLCKQVGNI